ncbi:RNA-binding protein [Sulfolobales archaeon HS-7]|nr:RNA-binding protein [Sulfolobales archaeon HS-7]
MADNEIVLPSQRLATEEEFMPGDNTYVINGEVRASQVGKAFFDMINRKVNVISPKKSGVILLKNAKTATGEVVEVRDDMAYVEIFMLDEKEISGTISAILPFAYTKEKGIESIKEAVRIGDIIRGKPLNKNIPVILTIKQKEFGVIFARCSICGTVLLREENVLKCGNCGNIEKRKLGVYMVKRNGTKSQRKE